LGKAASYFYGRDDSRLSRNQSLLTVLCSRLVISLIFVKRSIKLQIETEKDILLIPSISTPGRVPFCSDCPEKDSNLFQF
jgi:hypothetical protein